MSEEPTGIDACFNHWIAVKGYDPAGVMRVLGLSRSRPASWSQGESLVCDLAHRHDEVRTEFVLISPEINGWTIVYGPRCSLLRDNHRRSTRWVLKLSRLYEQAQGYFYGSQGDGSAWLVAEHGRLLRYYNWWEPSDSTGAPLPIEQFHMDRLGLKGPPEDLGDKPDNDVSNAFCDFTLECSAREVAASLNFDPVYGIPPNPTVQGPPLIAMTARGETLLTPSGELPEEVEGA